MITQISFDSQIQLQKLTTINISAFPESWNIISSLDSILSFYRLYRHVDYMVLYLLLLQYKLQTWYSYVKGSQATKTTRRSNRYMYINAHIFYNVGGNKL